MWKIVSTCLHTVLQIHTDIEDIELSSEERSYYIERFNQSVVAYDQLKMAETVGEGNGRLGCKTHDSCTGLCSKVLPSTWSFLTTAGAFGVVCKATLVNDYSTGDKSVAVKMAQSEFILDISVVCMHV